MAVDSRDKRFSLMGLTLPAPCVFPDPDGALGYADRMQFIFLYASRTSFQLNIGVFIDDVDVSDKAMWGGFRLTDSMGNIRGLDARLTE